jgi:hypothetical protein
MNAPISNTMKLYSFTQSDNFSSMVLYGTFMLSNIDYVGILDYSLKAIIGGVVWFGLKLIAEYYSTKIKSAVEEKKKKEQAIIDEATNKKTNEQG